jgi:hypothetical protein
MCDAEIKYIETITLKIPLSNLYNNIIHSYYGEIKRYKFLSCPKKLINSDRRLFVQSCNCSSKCKNQIYSHPFSANHIYYFHNFRKIMLERKSNSFFADIHKDFVLNVYL